MAEAHSLKWCEVAIRALHLWVEAVVVEAHLSIGKSAFPLLAFDPVRLDDSDRRCLLVS